MTREGLVAFAGKLPACIVAMETCCGAHFLGRTFAAQGHTVRLMSPEYVQPYVKSQKTDDRDAEAIAEAATRPTMRLVTLKSEAQLDLQVLHRARERLVTARTRLTNQLRAVLLERGVILPNVVPLCGIDCTSSRLGNCRSVPAWYGCCKISVKRGRASMSGSELMTTSSLR
jgi:transposase